MGSTVASGSSSASEALPSANGVLDFAWFASAMPSEANSPQVLSSNAETRVVDGVNAMVPEQNESDVQLPTSHHATAWADTDLAEDVTVDQDESHEVIPKESLQAPPTKRSRHRGRRAHKSRKNGNKNG